MKNIKQQILDFRSSTPKYLQWLLLGAAFVVVIILLTLVIGKKSNKTNVSTANQQITFGIEPKSIEFNDVLVDSTDNKTLNVSVNAPVVVQDVKILSEDGLEISDFTTTNDCADLTESCIINIIYKPKSVQKTAKAKLTVTWHTEDQVDILQSETVSVSYSAKKKEEPKPEIVPEPVVEPEPEPVPEPVVEPEPIVEPEPEPVKEKIDDAITTISPSNVFTPEPEPEFALPPEKCSEFAIAGYDASGKQIGWIKPERGANYFHPFSDKDCSNPTGKYDISTGIITSLEDGSKIGTDAEHIGYRGVKNRNVKIPSLSSPKSSATIASDGTFENAVWDAEGTSGNGMQRFSNPEFADKYEKWQQKYDKAALLGSATGAESVISSRPYDRTFILRQFKPIPATIVSEVRADPSVYGCDKTGNCEQGKNYSVPVRATVDRNVYSDDGRTIIIPTGTLLMGYLDGDLPGPYQTYGRMNIKWYQFIRPDGVEFNFGEGQDPYSGDAQGRMGVPGHGSTDYVEQMVMPILTAMVPAAVNMIAPIADTVVNQIDLDNNTIVQSGTMRSSEMAKQELISTWNKVAQKLLVDALDNTTPPFSIAAGTRINVFSPVDLIATCGDKEGDNRKCAFVAYNDENKRRPWKTLNQVKMNPNDSSWIGQVRSFDVEKYCTEPDKNGKRTVGSDWQESGLDYRTILAYCEAQTYQAINNKKNEVFSAQTQQQFTNKYGADNDSRSEEQLKAYNEDILGLTYDDDGLIVDPFAKTESSTPGIEETITCDDGSAPDSNGCCAGETYTDMGEEGFNCCPDAGGDCFPPIK
jgi:type IV secretory pathway VirB10-like protein